MRAALASAAATAATTTALVATAATPAAAITTYHSKPAPEYTAVGALVVDSPDDDRGPRWICSGTMIDEDTFLTAAHCTATRPEGTRFWVTLTPVVDRDDALAGAVEGTAIAHPSYPGTSSDSYDIAVVELGEAAAALPDFTPATLPPTVSWLDRFSSKTLSRADWKVVGYGNKELQRGPGGMTVSGGGERRQAAVSFNALNPTWVRLSQNQAKGEGGACYGDSGGPNFVTLDGTEYLAATTITGDVPCYATNVTYRLDSPTARTFLAPFVDAF